MSMLAVMVQSAPAGPNPMSTIVMFGGLFAIFYFLLIRPQKKQQQAHEEMVSQLAKGDEVVTLGGVVGRIIHVADDRITLKTAGDTRLEIERSKVARRLGASG